MPIVRDLNDLQLLKHVLFVTFVERASNAGGLPVVHETYTADTGEESYPGKEQFLKELREEFVDRYVEQKIDARCCGLMMMTSDSPISVDPGRTVPMSNAISLSLTAPLEWRAEEAMELGSAEGLVFNVAEAEVPVGGTITMEDIRAILDGETEDGMMIYGPMVYGSDTEITAYMGGIDAPDENFADTGRRMLASMVIETTAMMHERPDNQMAVALAEYLSGKCDTCEARDECPNYAQVSEMFPKGDDEAAAGAALLLAMLTGAPGAVPEAEDAEPVEDAEAAERPDHDNDDEV